MTGGTAVRHQNADGVHRLWGMLLALEILPKINHRSICHFREKGWESMAPRARVRLLIRTPKEYRHMSTFPSFVARVERWSAMVIPSTLISLSIRLLTLICSVLYNCSTNRCRNFRCTLHEYWRRFSPFLSCPWIHLLLLEPLASSESFAPQVSV